MCTLQVESCLYILAQVRQSHILLFVYYAPFQTEHYENIKARSFPRRLSKDINVLVMLVSCKGSVSAFFPGDKLAENSLSPSTPLVKGLADYTRGSLDEDDCSFRAGDAVPFDQILEMAQPIHDASAPLPAINIDVSTEDDDDILSVSHLRGSCCLVMDAKIIFKFLEPLLYISKEFTKLMTSNPFLLPLLLLSVSFIGLLLLLL